jgi:hypothetical protein
VAFVGDGSLACTILAKRRLSDGKAISWVLVYQEHIFVP